MLKIINALLTKREVKMAGYWQVLFLHFYGPRRSHCTIDLEIICKHNPKKRAGK